MTRARAAGYSLIELMIAMSLASVVMVAVVSVSSSLIRYQVQGMRKGQVTGWSIISTMAMNREIEDANVIVYPTTGGADWLVGCENWSRISGGRLNTNASAYGGDVTVFYYCFNEAGTAPDRPLYRYVNIGTAVTCPAAFAPGTCGSTAPGFTYTEMGLVATGVYRRSGVPYPFTRENTGKGITTDFVIGNPAPTGTEKEKYPVAVTIPVRFTSTLQKQYGNTSD